MKTFSSPLHLFQSYVVNLILIISIGDVTCKSMLGKICRIFFGLSVAHSDRLIVGYHSLLVPKGQAQDCKKQSKKQHTCKKQLINLEHLVFTGNLKPWPCHIDLAMAQTIWQGFHLRCFCNDLTTG